MLELKNISFGVEDDGQEKEIIRETLMEERGNITKAAEALSLRRQTLQHKLKKYGLREE